MTERKREKGGRPPVDELNDEQMGQVEALASCLTVEQIADYFGMGRTTFYRVMERQPEVSERYKKGRARAVGNVARSLLMQAQDGNLTAIIFYLKTQAGWRETQVVDNTSSDGSMSPKQIEPMNAAEMMAVLEKAKEIL